MIPPRLIVDNQASVSTTSVPSRIWSNDRNIVCQPRAGVRVERVMKPSNEFDKVRFDARMADAYALGLQAYLWGWPMVEAARIRARMLDPSFRHHAPPNVFHHEWSQADSVFSLFPAPCADQVYSEAFFDVSREPMVLHVPDTRGIHYWTAQICNFFTETLANVSSRTIGVGPGNYALVGPSWSRGLPPGVARIPVDQNIGFILLQLRCDNRDDLGARVRPVQHGFSLTSLSCLGAVASWRTPILPITDWRRRVPRGQDELHTSLTFFQVLNLALTEARPRPGEEALVALFNRIGVGPDLPFEPNTLDDATRDALALAIEDGWAAVKARSAATNDCLVNGWSAIGADANVGAWGLDTLQRAGCAHRALFSNVPAECVVLAGERDTRGEALSGAHRYTFRVGRTQFPKVDGYWSMTIYALPERRLPFCPENQTIDSFTDDLKYNADGSFDIWVQRNSPGAAQEANWLAAPEGPFEIVLRLYGATDPAAYFGTYSPGAIRRLSYLRKVTCS